MGTIMMDGVDQIAALYPEKVIAHNEAKSSLINFQKK